jgi:hypothetical protein
MKVTINNTKYDMPDFMRMDDKVKDRLHEGNYNSNGCGTNGFNKFFIGLLESWAKVTLILCCFIHDLSYEANARTRENKLRIDKDFNMNIYDTCMHIGVPSWKAATIANLFAAAVGVFGRNAFWKKPKA